MKSFSPRAAFIFANLVVINGVVIGYLALKYPIIGHDYSLGVPSILDSAIHFRLNGLSIQWFTPSFGGGIPAFPNPNNAQFSIFTLLALFVRPWYMVIFSSILFVSLGFVTAYFFLLRILRLHWTSAILGAAFFSANGYMVERVAAGHLGYISFPLVFLLLIFLFDRELPPGIAGVLLGLLFALQVQSAGYFILVIYGLSLLMLLPILYLYNDELFSWKRQTAILGIGAAVGFAISASKLAAVFSFMRYFPRTVIDTYPAPPTIGFIGLILQLLGTMNLVPLFIMAGLQPDLLLSFNYLLSAAGSYYGYWEFDMSLSPVVFGILLIWIYRFFRRPLHNLGRIARINNKVALLLFLFFTWLAIEFSLGRGLFYPMLRQLPILSSLHVNLRFAAAFILPATLTAALVYNRWIRTWHPQKVVWAFIAINALTLAPLASFFAFKTDVVFRMYDVTVSNRIFEDLRSGNSLEVTSIDTVSDNTQALLNRSSNLKLYEPIFGYELEYFHPEVSSGSIWEISDGYYNMTNPTGYVYPENNKNRPFERFRVEERETLATFARHLQPAWRIPVYQHILDWFSGLALIFALGSLVLFAASRVWSRTR